MTCRPEQPLLADSSSKRSRVDQSGVPDHSAPVDPVPSLHPALVSQPSLNGRSPSSTSVPVSDSAGVTLRPVSDHKSHRQAQQPADQPSSRHTDPQSDVNTLPEVATSHHRTQPSEQPSQLDRPQDSNRSHRHNSRHSRDSRHRSSSRRPDESSHRCSSSHRPPDSSRQVSHRDRDGPRHEARPASKSHHTGSDRQVSYSDRQSQPSRADRSEYRGSHEARQRPNSRAGGYGRDEPQGHRDYGRDRPRGDRPMDYRNGNHARRDYGRDAARQDRHKESDSHRDKRKREEKEDKVAS